MTWHQGLILAAVLILAGGAYRYSLHRHPTRSCHHCDGSGTHKGTIWTYSKGPCAARTLLPPRAQCDRGRVPRWGLRLLKPPSKEK